MSLFHFGTSDRHLLGKYEASVEPSRRGAVICNPWGQECLRAHPSIRLLAHLIAAEGLHVLRFDWYGSGDSAGDVLEGGHPDSWLEDLEWAVEELKATAHVSSVALVGLRLGASVAALAARDRSDVDRLVLWDPVVDGEEYLRELSNPKNVLHPAAWRDLAKSGEEPTCSVLGFPLTPTMRTGIRKIRPEVFDPPLPPTCLVSTVDDPERYTALRRRLRDGGADFADKVMDGPVTWVEEGDFGTSGMPVPALHAIAEWLK